MENVECFQPNQIKFDFLGKDSIRYENTVTVDPAVSWGRASSERRAGRPPACMQAALAL